MPISSSKPTALTKTYGRLPALDECTFSVQAGEVFGLLGPNGAGKTTLLRLLMGFLRADKRPGHDRRPRLRFTKASPYTPESRICPATCGWSAACVAAMC